MTTTKTQSDYRLGTTEIVQLFSHEPDLSLAMFAENLRVLWCNDRFAVNYGATPEALALSDAPLLQEPLAGRVLDQLRRAGPEPAPVCFMLLRRGRRELARGWRLDGTRFNDKGWLVAFRTTNDPLADDSTGAAIPTLTAADLGDLAHLTRRELEVLRLIAEGLLNREVANALHRAPKTVANQTTSLLRKLGLTSRVALTRLAVERGITGFARDDWALIAKHGAVAERAT